MGKTPLRFGILTISDRSFRKEREDRSGPILMNAVLETGGSVVKSGLAPDEKNVITDTLLEWCLLGEMDIILTTGGTGFSPRDITPEATREIIEREAPGLAELMRLESYKITPHAMLSRAVAGIRQKTIIINLPGSPKAAIENYTAVADLLSHAVALLQEEPSSEDGHSYRPKVE